MKSKTERFGLFAVTAPGLEALTAAELADLGIHGEVVPGGVTWEGIHGDLFRANLQLRTASRVLVRLGEFRARTFFELERHARRLDWPRFLSPERAVQLRVSCRKSRLSHERAIAQRFQEAIERAVGTPPAGVSHTGDAEAEGSHVQLLVIRFLRDQCTVSVDTSGALLHRRGYRQAVAKAPLRESLGAAMLLVSGWRGEAPLLDPFCGSGTIPIEAALLARRIAPGLATEGHVRARTYAFEQWPGHDPQLWEEEVSRARQSILPGAGVAIHGFDRDEGAIQASHANAVRAGVAADLHLARSPLSAFESPSATGWLVSNPPYGLRVGEKRPLRDLYAALGKLTRERLPGWTVILLSAERDLEAQVGLPFTDVLRTSNGGIPVRAVLARPGERVISTRTATRGQPPRRKG